MRSAEHNVISFVNIKRKFICCKPIINTFQLSVCDLKHFLIQWRTQDFSMGGFSDVTL